MKKIESPPASQNMREWYDNLDDAERQFILLWANMTTVLSEINTDYLYWDKVKYKSVADMGGLLTNRDLWMLVKNSRRKAYKTIRIGGETFFYLQNDPLNEDLHRFDLNLGGTLGGQQTIGETDRHQYLLGSIMEESIASSQIEGAIMSRVVAKEMLRKERPPRNVSERMIVNNYRAIQHIDAYKSDRLTVEGLLTVHRLMTDQTLDNAEEAGQFRQHDNIHVVDLSMGKSFIHPQRPAAFRRLLPNYVSFSTTNHQTTSCIQSSKRASFTSLLAIFTRLRMETDVQPARCSTGICFEKGIG
jgi:hypothetical protein